MGIHRDEGYQITSDTFSTTKIQRSKESSIHHHAHASSTIQCMVILRPLQMKAIKTLHKIEQNCAEPVDQTNIGHVQDRVHSTQLASSATRNLSTKAAAITTSQASLFTEMLKNEGKKKIDKKRKKKKVLKSAIWVSKVVHLQGPQRAHPGQLCFFLRKQVTKSRCSMPLALCSATGFG